MLGRALAPFFSGGGSARTLLDVLEQESASVREARVVGRNLAAISDRFPVLTRGMIETEIKKARRGTSPFAAADTTRSFDSRDCVFLPATPCPQCSSDGDPLVHGALLSPEEVVERIAEVRELLDARLEERVQ